MEYRFGNGIYCHSALPASEFDACVVKLSILPGNYYVTCSGDVQFACDQLPC